MTALACAPREALRNDAPSVLPTTRVQTLDGNTTDLAGVLHGRPALVNLWATWCDTCIQEAPALNRLEAEAKKGGDALVVGVAIGETPETVRGFTKTRPLEYTLLVDPDFRLADTLGERQVPATLVVDRAGHIVFRGKSLDADSLAAFRKVAQHP
ncbi:MAG TPA: TlpA disulfide reductase family protein [Polyangiaceae bacterium]|jgi:thiol-disulfide isomerase/thioredoxin|nr:TlpA disulfide reductase family protein [Polyangiaceae bacterium]